MTVYVPATVPVQDSVLVPELPDVSVMLVGDNEHVRPVAGETVEVRLTVPAKPLRLVAVIVEVPAVPIGTVTVVGLAARVKSIAAVVG